MAAQGGHDSALYCAAFFQIAERFPYLPQAQDPEYQQMSTACVDLTFELTPRGLLDEIQFEGYSLQRTLALIGAIDDAWLVIDAYDRHIDDVLPTLYDVLARLFAGDAVGRTTSGGTDGATIDPDLAAALDARDLRDAGRYSTFSFGLPD